MPAIPLSTLPRPWIKAGSAIFAALSFVAAMVFIDFLLAHPTPELCDLSIGHVHVDTPLLRLHHASNLLIGLSYLAVGALLAWVLLQQRHGLPYRSLFRLLALFLFFNGAARLFELFLLRNSNGVVLALLEALTILAAVTLCTYFALVGRSVIATLQAGTRLHQQRANAKFRALVQSTPLAVFSVDCNGSVVSWNPAAERLFGWQEAEVLHLAVPAIPPNLSGEFTALFNRTLGGTITTNFQTKAADRAGNCFSVSLSTAPVRDDEGKLQGLLCIVEDIREHEWIQRELHETSLVLSTVTKSLNVFLETGDWTAASRLLLSLAIHQTESRFGLLGVVLEGHALRFLTYEGVNRQPSHGHSAFDEKLRDFSQFGFFEVPSHTALFQQVIGRGETLVSNSPTNEPLFHKTPLGHSSVECYMGIPICKGSETVALIIVGNRPGGYTGNELRSLETISRATGVLFDNYRQSLQRRELESQRVQLEGEFRQSQKTEVLGRLAGGVAHDFNNMLMVLASSTELLEAAVASNPQALQYLVQIRRTTDKAAAITRQLLAFSRKQLLDIKPVDIHEILTDSEFMLPRLLGSDVELTFQHGARNSWIKADPSQIGQVIANLAINARDAMPSGGQLTITTRNDTSLPQGAHLEFAEQLDSEWVVLAVSDTGSGMDEQTRSHIFEPFFTTKPVGRGTGLGLSTVYGIVKQCSGHIYVDSQPGAGTSFAIYFPRCASARSAPIAMHQPAVSVSTDGLTILVADDEAPLRNAVAEFLRTEGHQVLEANSTLDALEIARLTRDPIDLLLTDVVMPALRGPDLAREVSLLHPETRVMYMSGYAEGLPETEIPDGAVFLQKPFRFSALREQITIVSRTAGPRGRPDHL